MKSGTKIKKLTCEGDAVRVSTLYQLATRLFVSAVVSPPPPPPPPFFFGGPSKQLTVSRETQNHERQQHLEAPNGQDDHGQLHLGCGFGWLAC